MDNVLTILLASIAGGLFGFFGNLISVKINKPKIAAETRKLISDTNGIDQQQFIIWVDKYEQLYRQLEVERKEREAEKVGERKSREAERKEIDRQIESLKDEILSMQMLKGAMLSQITNLQQQNIEKDIKIAKMEKENTQLKELVHKHGLQIGELRKSVTGQLPPR
jgi:chromosome segregation ATPase